jgi:surface antigen Omp85-like protein
VITATKLHLRAFALGLVVVLIAPTAHAQQGNTSTPPEKVATGTAATDPASDSSFVTTAKDWAKRTQIIERLQGDVDGWYPRFGITRGSGFALGPGYRTHVLGDQVLVDVSGALSYRLYKAFDIRARWLQTWHERAELWTDYRIEDYPQEHFYGIGPETTPTTRTSYDLHGSDVRVRGELKPWPWLKTGLIAGYLTPRIGRGHAPDFPSTEEIFTDATVPGLVRQPDFVHTEVFADVDYRENDGNPTGGGFYHVAYGAWNDRTLDRYDFQRFDSNFAQYVPLTANRRHIVSGRLDVSFVNNAPASRVPFYVLPYIGGQDTVRSFREFRFRDENAMSFGAEYRWIPRQWVSGVLFADFGKVGHNWQDLNLSELKKGYGFGMRVHSKSQTFASLDFGFGGGEGWRTFLKIGPF